MDSIVGAVNGVIRPHEYAVRAVAKNAFAVASQKIPVLVKHHNRMLGISTEGVNLIMRVHGNVWGLNKACPVRGV